MKPKSERPAAQILIVDDEPDLRALLQRYLTENGYAVHAASDGTQMNRLLEKQAFDAIVLDLMLPGEDGLAICRRLRAAGEHAPILMLTARGDAIDRIIGLEMGADDYLPKPFNPRELLARIQALLRRQTVYDKKHVLALGETIRFGEFTLDLDQRELRKGSEIVMLTTGEFCLLRALACNPLRPLTRDRLSTLMSEDGKTRERDAFDRSIDVQVVRLRKMIEVNPAEPVFIKTVWGVGYVFNPAFDSSVSGKV
jgi:two-component system, OmpR family, phosphate regulon response regulator OmpR